MPHKLDDSPDHLLIEQCRHGNEAAFNVLFRRYFNKLHQFALKFVKDRTVAESLVLDLMLHIWQKSELIDDRVDIAPYLFTAMKNRVFNHIRKKYRETVTLEEIPEKHQLLNASDEALEASELASAYHHVLEQLSPQRKKVFEMSRNQAMSHKEIAAELQLSVNTVENHISASIRFLRQNLKNNTDIAFVLTCYFLL